MKKYFFLLLTLVAFLSDLKSQLYRNEWIDYNKTYYKFKVGPFGYDNVGAPLKNGIVRIPQSSLVSAGLANVPAEQLQLWRDGQEVAIYTSKPSGLLSSSDYIEFFGELANGKADKDLYTSPDYQLSDYWNLSSDSSAYFLTTNSSGNNKRIVDATNDLTGNTRQAEKNFNYKVGRYYRATMTEGRGAYFYQIYALKILYESEYLSGEGFSSRPVHPDDYYEDVQMPQYFSSLYLDTTGPAMTAKYYMCGNAPDSFRNIKIYMNGDSLSQFFFPSFSYGTKVLENIPANKIKTDNVNFVIQNLSLAWGDEIRVAAIEFQYPHRFNFGGTSTFEFNIEASPTGRYLKIANFNKGISTPELIDLTNNKRYIANTDNPDTLQFLLPPSALSYHLVLSRSDGSTAKSISTFQPKQFKNYGLQQNQGNYLIISNPVLYGTGNQDNYVQQYKEYRSSDSGGHFNAQIYDIDQLIDQFAYGIDMHPLSIKNFLRYARDHFTVKPDFTFLIGKGLSYITYRVDHYYDPLTLKLNLIPTFGSPGSDNLLSADNFVSIPQTPIGRLSAVSAIEVGDYLKKVRQYEALQRDTITSGADRKWLKKILLLAGADDEFTGQVLDTVMPTHAKIIADTLFGGDVYSYNKHANPVGYSEAVLDFTNQFNAGSSLLEYTGHSNSNNIDFNLDNPENYKNDGKYPFFVVNGCLAGNIFDYDINRYNNRQTLSEKFVLEPGKGAIGYLASTNLAELSFLDLYTREFYKSMSSTNYGNAYGRVIKDAITNALDAYPDEFFSKILSQQYTLHGDPAVKMNSSAAPDFFIDSLELQADPSRLNITSDSFSVKFTIHNLGKAVNDSLPIKIIRTFPDQSKSTVFLEKISPVFSKDSMVIKLPIVGNRDKGTTIITVVVNDNNIIPDLDTTNNIASVNVNITAADLLPVSPYNYSIVNVSDISLIASTATNFNHVARYILELDTTALFNSPNKISQASVSTGGTIEFAHIPLMLDNTVYYWRVSEDSAVKYWNGFSFIHKQGGNQGFEQSHFYQHTESSFDHVYLDSSSRFFKFGKAYHNLYVQHSIYPTSGTEDNQFSASLNGTIFTWSACVGSSIIFNVIDPITFKPISNTTFPYGAGPVCDPMRLYNFEYSTQDRYSRKNAMDFLDNFVANGYYVIARKIYDLGNADWAPTVWRSDTTFFGHNNSLYHRLKDQGTQIDSFNYPRTFVMIFKKNDSLNYKARSVFSKGIYDRISFSDNIASSDTIGSVSSPLFGPGKAWNKVLWNGSAVNKNNNTTLDILAVGKDGSDTLFYTIDTSQHSYDISSIDAAKYPNVQLRMHTTDSITANPYQLKDWTVEFVPVPEGALAPNLGGNIPDTLWLGHEVNLQYDTLKGSVVFKNISNTAFIPLKVKVLLYDVNNNLLQEIPVSNTKPLAAGDTVLISFKTNVTSLPSGKYNLYLDVNPDDDQPEQYHFNNFFYKYIVIEREIVLASRLFDLTAKPFAGSVKLDWNITNETNAAYYIVEHSSNGRDFKEVGKVNASSLLTTIKYYGFIHGQPSFGKNYYRIKLVTKNGTIAYSPVRMVVLDNVGVKVFPNPFKEQLTVSMEGSNINGNIKLLDLSGRLIRQQKFNGFAILNTGKISSGIYVVQLYDGTTMHSFKVFKD